MALTQRQVGELEQATITNWRIVRINGVEVVGSIEHLLWRLSEDNHALRPFVGDDAVGRLLTHIGDTVEAARFELEWLQKEKDADKQTINRLDNQNQQQQAQVEALDEERNGMMIDTLETEPVRGIAEEPCLIGEDGIVPIRRISGLCCGGGGNNFPVPYWVGATYLVGDSGVGSVRIGNVEDADHGQQAITNILEQFRAALRLSKDGQCHDLKGQDLIPAKR